MKCTVLFFLACFLATGLCAQEPASLRKKQFNLSDGIAVSGYDPVTYFTLNKAVKGSKENAFVCEGITYYFSTFANREEFKKNPSKYEPSYGGWCAYAMGAKGEKVEVDPKTFKIVDGKLNLFYNRFFNNTLTDWNKDESSLKKESGYQLGKNFSLTAYRIVMKIQLIFTWLLRLVAAGIMLMTLYYKFTAHEQSVRLFTELGMEPWGRIGTGVFELIASALILYPRTTGYGATLGMGLMAGAIFFHITKLGLKFDGDYGLFTMALIAFVCSFILLIIYRNQLLGLLKKNHPDAAKVG